MDITTFKRAEIKFLVTASQRAMLEKAFAQRMIPDEHGESTICNIYCDTPDFRLIRRSLEKPVYKEKFRIRSYGRVKEDGKVFMELKKKYDGIVYKRRISLTQADAVDYINGCEALPKDGQIEREIDYFVKFYGGLVPAMYICYDRSAYFCEEDPGLRVTFDRNILWRTENVSLTSRPSGRQILKPGQSLMEIKCAGAIPMWLVELLSKGGIRQISFSKYGTAYTTMIREMNERGVYCA
ncbi:MAG: polyphosphate polymerase domain-containing protein [Ruminiclostridium sp.]|nr:polyphosphate polymerase domain-containing protein [Ruminiclostridium sp.]